MADASAVTAVSGLGNDPLFKQVQASLNKLVADLGRLRMFTFNRIVTAHGLTFTDNLPNLTNGASNGKLKLTNTITYGVLGVEYAKAAGDNLWDLTGETYSATLNKAYLLLLSSAGTASFTSASSTTAAKAIQSVLVLHTDTTKSAVGLFVADTGATFGNSWLTSQGSLYNGLGALPDLQAFVANWG